MGEVLPGGTGQRRVSIRRHDEEKEDGGPVDLDDAAMTQPVGVGPAEAPGTTARKRHLPQMEKAVELMDAAPARKRLEPFYNALMDHFPGYQEKITKLLIKELQADLSDDSSDSSSSSSRKKRK